jgi:mannan endo-1,4-beta-mannosidase
MYRNLLPFIILPLILVESILAQEHHYIKVQDTHFILEGKPYYFLGTNLWYGCYLGSTGRTGDRGRLIRELDRLKEIGVNNLRILGASESSSIQASIKPAIQISPGVYDDSLLIGLDFLLAEMSKRDMHAVIFLNNFWTWSGGMSQYQNWFSGSATTFYRNIEANIALKQYIRNLIQRKNTITGLHYYEDPAIMAWQLANEPRPFSSYDEFYNWIDSTAQFIHSIDPNHLVTTGSEGLIGCNINPTVFLTAHQNPSIDYATFHLWAYNWNWYNPSGSNFSSALANARTYIQYHIAYAQQLNKPITMEEFGLPRDNKAFGPTSTTTFRDQYFDTLLKLIYDSASIGAPIAGSNYWGWGGEARSPNGDYIWRVGDPFMCDPPMEEQGLNSVYDTDTSTIFILKKYSTLMKSLRVTGVVSNNAKVYDFELYQNYPNPFNPETKIEFQIHKVWAQNFVSLRVYDLLGREVAVLVNEEKQAGRYSLSWDATNYPSGIYCYRLSYNGLSVAKIAVLIK